MKLEGESCWSETEYGPVGCICGNDCEPPAPLREVRLPGGWEDGVQVDFGFLGDGRDPMYGGRDEDGL